MKHNVYIHDICNNYFNIEYTVNNSDKSADNQSEARISVAYNTNCHLSLMTSFVKCPPRPCLTKSSYQSQLCTQEIGDCKLAIN